MTAEELITAAVKEIGFLAAGESLDPDSVSDCFDRLNDWIDALGTERLTIGFVLRTTKTLTASTTSYTIGSGGAINIVRPTWIESAGLVIDTTATTPTEIPLRVFTDQEWQGISQKTLTSAQSSGIYYDHGWTAGLGIVYPYPVPTVGTTQLVLYTPQALTEFADLSTDYTFAPGYRRFLVKGAAREFLSLFGVPGETAGRIEQQAEEAKAAIKRANFRMDELGIDPAYWPRRAANYSIYTDGN